MFYSQYGQDIFLAGLFKHKQNNGFFIDIGAYDGRTFSNTYLLESEYNWQGICVEANKDVFNKLKENRDCIVVNALIYNYNGKLEFTKNLEQDFMSGIEEDYLLSNRNKFKEEKIQYDCIDINRLFELYNVDKIDYLSIDVEGSEFKILKKLDFDKYEINVISFEINSAYFELIDLLKSKDYKYLASFGQDEFFIKKDSLNDIAPYLTPCRNILKHLDKDQYSMEFIVDKD